LTDDMTVLPNAPDNTHTEILRATFRVLCERGYTGVTISRIAARTDVAKSVVYYHYEDKDDIIQTLLDQVLAELLSEYFRDSDDDPARRLENFFGFVFAVAGGEIHPEKNTAGTDECDDVHLGTEETTTGIDSETNASEDAASSPSDTAEKEFKYCVGAHSQAYVELRAQAAHDEVFRKTITANERKLREELRACVDAGVATGAFDIDNASNTTEFLLTLIEGAIFRGATTSKVDTDALADMLDEKLGIIVHQDNL
jgi:AcrR family transcriptional regulator